jgi:GxxExxY protein
MTRLEQLNALSERVIGAAIEVHRHLGPGLLESAYQRCLETELRICGIPYRAEVPLPVQYKDCALDCAYRMDLLIDGKIIVELKSVDDLLPVHTAQLLTYLRLQHLKLGLMINFNVPVLWRGIRRVANGL